MENFIFTKKQVPFYTITQLCLTQLIIRTTNQTRASIYCNYALSNKLRDNPLTIRCKTETNKENKNNVGTH